MAEGVGAALVDFESGMSLGTLSGGDWLDLEVASAGNTEVVRSKPAAQAAQWPRAACPTSGRRRRAPEPAGEGEG